MVQVNRIIYWYVSYSGRSWYVKWAALLDAGAIRPKYYITT